MKGFQSILLYLLAAAVVVLFVLHFISNPVAGKGGEKVSPKNPNDSLLHLRVAYIDLDTVKEYYAFFKLKNEEIEREKARIENEIQTGLNKLEKDRLDFLKKGDAITQVDAENFQRQYQERYQQLGAKRESLLNQHLENQARALDAIQKKINDFLIEFNKKAKYNFVFSTGEGNLTLYYKDSAYNITREVITGLNEAYQKGLK